LKDTVPVCITYLACDLCFSECLLYTRRFYEHSTADNFRHSAGPTAV